MRIKKEWILFFISSIGIVACAHPQVKFSNTQEIHHAVHPSRSTLPAYELTGGIWVEGQALFINHDFDFGMAMGIPDIGPAIAAGLRKKRNEEVATLFKVLSPLSLESLFNEAIKKSDKKNTIRGDLRLYGILFGYPEAHLKVILETNEGDDTPNRFIYLTDWLPIEGDQSWSADQGQQIKRSFRQAMPRLVKMWESKHSKDSTWPEIAYRFSNGKSSQKGQGWIIEKNGERLLILSKTIPNTVISFPRSKVKSLEPNQRPRPSLPK